MDEFLTTLRIKNVERCEQVFHKLNYWQPWEWSNAMAGEVGEVCNLTKKMLRNEVINTEEIAKEIADVIIYADLLAARLGIDLEEAIIEKFNEVSKRRKSDIFL
jgi:NTP pyrophosphatase (non-canonical NTP hydrolase)